jgi:uncharacterized protein (TIGR02266 family)
MTTTSPIQSSASGATRRSERIALKATITIESENNFFTGFSENISEGGVFVTTPAPPPVGSQISVEVNIDDSPSIQVMGEVRWHRIDSEGMISGCGVKFINLERAVARQLQGMLYQSPQVPLLVEEG